MNDVYVSARSIVLKVNALGGARAMELAMDEAGNHVFSHCVEGRDKENALPEIGDHEANSYSQIGGYEISVIRIGYSNSDGGHEFDADYAISSCSEPMPLYEPPDIQDDTDGYYAEKHRTILAELTPGATLRKSSLRL